MNTKSVLIAFKVYFDPDGNTEFNLYKVYSNANCTLPREDENTKIFWCKRDAYSQVYPDICRQPAKNVYIMEYIEVSQS